MRLRAGWLPLAGAPREKPALREKMALPEDAGVLEPRQSGRTCLPGAAARRLRSSLPAGAGRI